MNHPAGICANLHSFFGDAVKIWSGTSVWYIQVLQQIRHFNARHLVAPVCLTEVQINIVFFFVEQLQLKTQISDVKH